MKKVLITGVTGMDGSTMVDYLLKNTDHTIIGGIRRLSVKNHINIQHLANEPRFQLIDLDITDPVNVERVVREEQPDYFINFAANSFVGNSWDMPVNHMTTNCMAVLYQLEAIRKFAPNCRYYNAGSSEEWGNVDYSPQDEKHPAKPRSPYGASKVAARQLVKVWRESYDIYALQGWLLNHEGVRRGEEFVTRKITKKVAEIKKCIEAGVPFQPLELGNLDSKRDWSDSEDFVDGIWRMLNQEEHREDLRAYHITRDVKQSSFWADKIKEYVLSSNETHTVREFVERAFCVAGVSAMGGIWHEEKGNPLSETYLGDCDDTFAPYGKLVVINPKFYRPAEVDLLWGDSTKARTELGWEPKTSFHGLIEKMVDNDLRCATIKRG